MAQKYLDYEGLKILVSKIKSSDANNEIDTWSNTNQFFGGFRVPTNFTTVTDNSLTTDFGKMYYWEPSSGNTSLTLGMVNSILNDVTGKTNYVGESFVILNNANIVSSSSTNTITIEGTRGYYTSNGGLEGLFGSSITPSTTVNTSGYYLYHIIRVPKKDGYSTIYTIIRLPNFS